MRRVAFYTVALLVPVLVLAAAEGVLRLTWAGGRLPLFVTAAHGGGAYRVANPRVARRWFAREAEPPAPPSEPFPAEKPPRVLRVIALGESSTAGFPHPRNGAFPRVLRDMLADMLRDSVEVVNVGIPATNSYALLDEVDEVIAEQPDAVVIYAGHNEYYGALGVGSAQGRIGGSPRLVRTYLRLLRLRLALAMREAIARGARRAASAARDSAEASFMESLAGRHGIPLDGDTYRAGLRQYEENLGRVVSRLREAGVATYVGSVVSNVRDQRPFAHAANQAAGGADAVYDAARAALARGDSAVARAMFERARDLDVIRFRAPSAMDSIVRRVATGGVVYVPVREAFEAASPARSPGRELLLEHLHPTRAGTVLIARAFAEAMARGRIAGRALDASRLRASDAYERSMRLTPLDERMALHTVRTLQARWPFVPADRQTDYRTSYRPVDMVDSLAMLASRGLRWEVAKLRVADHYVSRGRPDSAAAEYAGLVRDAPYAVEPRLALGRAQLAAADTAGALATYDAAMRVHPTAEAARQLGLLAVQRRDFTEGIRRLRESLALAPDQPVVLYQLSLAAGLARDLATAREAAERLARLDPRFPGLSEWMRVIGMAP